MVFVTSIWINHRYACNDLYFWCSRCLFSCCCYYSFFLWFGNSASFKKAKHLMLLTEQWLSFVRILFSLYLYSSFNDFRVVLYISFCILGIAFCFWDLHYIISIFLHCFLEKKPNVDCIITILGLYYNFLNHTIRRY